MSPTPRTPEEEHTLLGSIFALDGDASRSAETQADPADGRGSRLLRQVELRHFGSHRHTRLAFDQPITCLVGGNGSGKTTIPEAIEWALTGRYARGIDGGGRGADQCVLTGEGGMRVGVELAQVGWVKRGFEHGKLKFAVGDLTGDPKVQQAQIYERLATTEAFLHAVFNAYAFLDMPHAEAKAFVLQLLNVRVTAEGRELTLEQLEARYQAAFEERRLKKAQRAALHVPVAPDGIEVEAEEVVALEEQLLQLRVEERTLAASGAEASGRRKQLESNLDDLTRERGTLQERIARYGNPHDDLKAIETELQALTDAAAEDGAALEQEALTLRSTLVDARGRLKMFSDSVKAIEGHSPDKGCVLNADIPCQTAAKEFTGRLKVIPKETKALERQIDAATSRLNVVEAEARSLLADRQAAGQRRANLERDRAGLRETAGWLQTAEIRLTDVLDGLATTQADIERCGPVQVNPWLETIRTRIDKGEAVIKDARALAHRWKEHRTMSAGADAMNRAIDELEARVQLLGPNGARVQAIAGALEAFLSRINGSLQAFGYQLAIELEPWRILVNGRPAVRLSTSERLRVGMCLQLALAELSALHLVVFDNTEWLVDDAVRQVFTELVMMWAFEVPGRQVLLIKATAEALPAVEGVAVYRVALVDGVSSAVLERDGTAATP